MKRHKIIIRIRNSCHLAMSYYCNVIVQHITFRVCSDAGGNKPTVYIRYSIYSYVQYIIHDNDNDCYWFMYLLYFYHYFRVLFLLTKKLALKQYILCQQQPHTCHVCLVSWLHPFLLLDLILWCLCINVVYRLVACIPYSLGV